MAKEIKVVPTAPAKKKTDEKPPQFALGRENYILMAIGIALIFIGFVLMIGGGSKDPNVFNYNMFNAQRLTLSPILILAGFVVEIFAIMKKPKD
ncbi:MAG TPA: DUF3098 domain-containing protein [Bacteroidales bacterium]|nr:DUF3098 domain-containing protein [Bacteroidales bacterium]